MATRVFLVALTLALFSEPLWSEEPAAERYVLAPMRARASDRGVDPGTDPGAAPGAEGAPSAGLPEEIPEPFRSELSQDGLRLSQAGGQPLYDLWFRKRIPLRKTESTEMSVQYRRLQVGTFMGVLRSYGGEFDYHESPIDKGFYLLRYGVQPDDGDHMGTSESRDFLMLTRFKEDRELDPVEDMEKLIDLALSASAAGDHPMILFLDAAATETYERPRLYRHEEREEWIVDVRLPARPGGEKESSSLRLGLVLVGVSENF